MEETIVYICPNCGAKLLQDADNLFESEDGRKFCGVCAINVDDNVKKFDNFVDAESFSTER